MVDCCACRLGLLWECQEGCKDDAQSVHLDSGGDRLAADLSSGQSDLAETEEEEPKEFRTYKDDSALRDQQSTGRKRAAKMYPMKEGEACEWKMQKSCGGGELPIIGCIDGRQEARHHGPDKNTLNNEEGNVHRICHTCHNRWHTLNDEGYVWGTIYNLHKPLPANGIDIGMNEEFWAKRGEPKKNVRD